MNLDGSYLFRTDGNGINEDPLANNVKGIAGGNFWTAIYSDWTNDTPNCSDWTDTSVSNFGAVGWEGNTGAADWLTGGQLACSVFTELRCVEQP